MAGALDDLVALAEADACAGDAVLFPQLRDLLFDRLMLRDEAWIVPLAECMQKLGALVREPLDVRPDV